MEDDVFVLDDQTGLHRYFGMTPHLINHLGLPPIAKAAYLFLLEDAGLHGGESKCGARKLADGAEIAIGSVAEAKRALRAAGLITWTPFKTKTGASHRIVLRDIWRINTYVFSRESEGDFSDRVEKARLRLRETALLLEQQLSLEQHTDDEPPSRPTNGDAPQQTGMFPKRKPAAAAPRAVSGTSLWRQAFEQTAEARGWRAHMRDAGETFKALGALQPPVTETEIIAATEELMQGMRPAHGKAVWVYFNKLPTTIRARRNRPDENAPRPLAADIDMSGYLDE